MMPEPIIMNWVLAPTITTTAPAAAAAGSS